MASTPDAQELGVTAQWKLCTPWGPTGAKGCVTTALWRHTIGILASGGTAVVRPLAATCVPCVCWCYSSCTCTAAPTSSPNIDLVVSDPISSPQDEEALLLAELERIKKERAEEAAKKVSRGVGECWERRKRGEEGEHVRGSGTVARLCAGGEVGVEGGVETVWW